MTKGKSNVKKSGQKNRRVLWTPHDRTNTQDTTSNISSGKNKPIRQQQRMQRVTIKVPAGTLPGHQVKVNFVIIHVLTQQIYSHKFGCQYFGCQSSTRFILNTCSFRLVTVLSRWTCPWDMFQDNYST